MLNFAGSFAQLKEDGCQLAFHSRSPRAFLAILDATDNEPCTTGCAYFNGGKCPAYLKHNTLAAAKPTTATFSLIGGKWAGMNSAKIQAQEGISRAEFVRRKAAGNYRE